MTLGLLVFFALKIATNTRLGAVVMEVGVLLGVVAMILRLRASSDVTAEAEFVRPGAGA